MKAITTTSTGERYAHEVSGDCGYICGFEEPYGFVPEAGCPIHDKMKSEAKQSITNIAFTLILALIVGAFGVLMAKALGWL